MNGRGRHRGARPSARAAALCALLAGCSPGGGGPQPSAAAQALAGFALGTGPQAGTLLLVRRFEVTAAEFSGRVLGPGEADLPATGMTRAEAAAWAAARGMRLPTREEWQHLATAGQPGRFPWGPDFEPWSANTLHLGLHRALPVGTFESGRNPLGCYDLGGNVWEWVDGGPGEACGGSYASQAEAAAVSVRRMHPEDRAEDVGFRTVAEAEPWIRDRVAPLWMTGPPEDRRALEEAFAAWPAELRVGLAARLEADGCPPAFCSALRRARAE